MIKSQKALFYQNSLPSLHLSLAVIFIIGHFAVVLCLPEPHSENVKQKTSSTVVQSEENRKSNKSEEKVCTYRTDKSRKFIIECEDSALDIVKKENITLGDLPALFFIYVVVFALYLLLAFCIIGICFSSVSFLGYAFGLK